MTTLDIPSLNPGDIYTICKNPKYLSDYRVVVHNDIVNDKVTVMEIEPCLLYTSPSPRDS